MKTVINQTNRMKIFDTKIKSYVVIIIILLSGCSPKTDQQSNGDKKYNVLFIVVDDLRPELGAYGAEHIVSPNIDRLAEKSLVFERAYCQAPICSPSRMSFLSGLRPNETNIHNNDTPIREKLPDIVTLPQHFKNLGYQAEAYGKVFHGDIGDSASWDFYNDRPKNRQVYQLPENTAINDVNNGKRRGRTYEAADVVDDEYSDGIIANRALLALERFDENRPFFLAVGFLKPHLPFLAPKKYWDLYDINTIPRDFDSPRPEGSPKYAFTNFGEMKKYHGISREGSLPLDLADTLVHGYYACVSYMDAQVGRLMDRLEEKQLMENTIIVLLGDHGYMLGEMDEWCKNTHYELSSRVPLIIQHPDKPTGRTSSITELIDVYPTLVAAAELPEPENQSFSGINLMPLFDNPNQMLKNAAFGQRPRRKVEGFTVRTDRYRLVKWIDKKDPDSTWVVELYDYEKSPIEKTNLADDPAYQEKKAELLELIKKEIGK